ncbi:MAG: DUF2069 domain-containing protein [Plesiomonas sp.]|uniref:DUF2069 domain-containing protein n=1 Tax=Plesiomonas sp. TaxID=2486279 RepID=UPI003F366FAD
MSSRTCQQQLHQPCSTKQHSIFPMPENTVRYWQASRLFWLSLLFWQILWHALLSPHPHVASWAITLGWSIPLLFPLKGIIQGKAYTHAWANFILMLYFLHALTIISIDEGERLFGIIELILASGSFCVNLLFAKKRGKELGLSLKKQQR